MATAAPANVREIEIFRHNALTIHKAVRLNVNGLTHDQSLVQPQPGGSCMNWIVGHLLWVYQGMLPLLAQAPVMEREGLKRYARGTPPLRDSAEARDFQELMSVWDKTTERINAGLGSLTTEALDKPAAFSPSNNPNETLRSLLSTIFFHQAYHAGQTGILRRIAGKDGAIA